MINPYYFIPENLKTGFEINLDSQIVKHANSLLSIQPNFPDLGI